MPFYSERYVAYPINPAYAETMNQHDETQTAAAAPDHGWLSIGTAKSLAARFRADLRALGPDTLRDFWQRLTIGFVLAAGAGGGMTLLARWAAARGLDAWDARALDLFLQHPPFGFYEATVFESPGNIAMVLPILAVTAIVAIRRGAPLVALGFVGGYALLRLLVIGCGLLWNRSRPGIIAEGLASPTIHGFPSGHATFSAFVYGFLLWLWWRSSHSGGERALALALTIALLLLIACARLRMGTHWPSDLPAGFLLGSVWAGLVAWACSVAPCAPARRRR